jgi:glycosyltransferase involved in cell wall biosynthesis
MKICFLVSSLSDGGAERVATTLCNAWVERGDAVTLIPTFSGRGAAFYDVSPLVELIYLADVVGVMPRTVWGYGRRIHALRNLIVKRSPDVIVSFLTNVNVAAIFSSAFLRVPVIICERVDPSFDCPRLLTSLCKSTYRFADMLTVQTEAVADRVVNIYPGLKKVRSIPNPLPESLAAITFARRVERKVLLSVGRLAPQKQLDKLLSAFAEVAPIFEDWDLHIYGDGPLKGMLEDQIHKTGLHGRAMLKGTTNRVWEIMAGADAFAMVSKYEGFPNALLEAMGTGLPCVVFDCLSGPREITRDGRDAFLIPPDDHYALVSALMKLMENEELRSTLGTRARESVCSRFSLPKIIEKWDHLFEEVGIAR